LAVFAQGAQAKRDVVAVGAEAERDRLLAHRILELVSIQIARAFGQQIGRQRGQPLLPDRIAGRTAAPGSLQCDDRNGGFAHEPDLDAARRADLLDLWPGSGRTRDQADGEPDAENQGWQADHASHSGLLSSVPWAADSRSPSAADRRHAARRRESARG